METYSSVAGWCSQQAALARRAVTVRGAAGAASCPYASVRDELVRRLRTIDAPLAAGVEAAPLYANPDWAAVKLDGWAARLAQLAAVAARGNEGPALCQGSGKRLPEASVSARVVNLFMVRPEAVGWSAREIGLAVGASKSAVAESPAYKRLDTARELARLERAEKAEKANQAKGDRSRRMKPRRSDE